jgi:hypothetical protein
MEMRMRFSAISAALVLLLAACGGDEFDPGEYDVTGRWTGTALQGDSLLEFDLRLSQTEEDISGDGEVRAGGETVDVTVRGDFGFPQVDLTLSAPGFVPLTFDAQFRRDTVAPAEGTRPAVLTENRNFIVGTFTNSALERVALQIVRDTARD